MLSEKLFKEASELFPGGVNSPVRYYEPFPRFIKEGKGSGVIDADNGRYIDYCLGFGPMILGHGDHAVVKAVQEQAEKGFSFGAPGEPEVRLAEMIREAVPSVEMMRFTNSGTEATMHAIRLARHFTGRNLIVKIEGGFHGSHDYALNSIPSNRVGNTDQNITIEVPFNDVEAISDTFQRYGNKVAALILEPVLGNIGVVRPDPEFLRVSRKLTTESGSLLIFDEVITAFRFGYKGYQDLAGIKPDLTTMGKIIGGGLPVGLFGGREEIMKNVAPRGKLYQQGTFSGNPLSMVSGIATLTQLKMLDYEKPTNYTKRLSKEIAGIMSDEGINATVNQAGTMFTIFFSSGPVANYATAIKSDAGLFFRFFQEMLKNGIFMPKSQFEACFVSFAHGKEDYADTLEAVRKSVSVIAAAE